MKKTTILSISLLTIMASAAISPALGNIAAFFSETDPTTIKLIITLPSIMIIPFSFLSGKLADCMKKKTLLVIGLLAYISGGIGGGFVSDIHLLLLLRGLLGVGVGLILPISSALISDFYKGEEATKMTGWVAASNNLGGIIAVVFSGWLATLSWRYAFMVYLIGLVPLLLVALFLPEPEKQPEKTRTAKRLPPVVFTASFLMFFVMVVFYAIPTNIAMFIRGEDMGSAGASGMALATVTTASFIAGAMFSRVQAVFKSYMAALQAALMAAGFYCIACSNTIAGIFVGGGLIGFSFGNFFPMALLLVVKGVPREQNVKAMAVVGSFIFFGQFFSPVFFDAIAWFTGKTDIRFVFRLAAALMTAAAILFIGKKISRLKRSFEHDLTVERN